MSDGFSSSNQRSKDNLRQSWRLFAFASLAMLAFGFLLIGFAWRVDLAFRWLVLPAAATAYLLFVLRRSLDSNHRPGEQALLPSLGWGNRLTLLRGAFVAALTGFLFLPLPPGPLAWLPGILYILSVAADFFDGYLARVTNHATRLGEILDMSFDGLGIGVAALLAIRYGQVPTWYLAVTSARPLFLLGLWLRQRLGLPIFDLQPSLARRLFAGLQMGFLAVVLLPLFSPPGTHIAAALFSLPLLAGFMKDWWTVTGVVRFSVQSGAARSDLARWLPLGLRLAVLALNVAGANRWLELSSSGDPFAMAVTLSNLFLVLAVILGIVPRITSIFALTMLGFFQIFAPLSPDQIALAVSYTSLIYLGGGGYSLWMPDERLFTNHLGERPIRALEQSI